MSAVVDTTARGRANVAAEMPRAAESAATRTRAPVSTELQGADDYHVTQPILFKRRSTLAAIILSLRAAAPPTVSSVTLYGLAQGLGIQSTEFFSALTVLVTVLSIVLLQPVGNTASELLAPWWKLAISLLIRWAVLLVVLLAIGYATHYVPHYPQLVMLIWALATPVVLILVTLGLHELARRAVCRPQNCRNVVFAGCNDTSIHLAERFSRHSELCMAVRGFFDDRSSKRLDAPSGLNLLGRLVDLPAFVKQHDIDVIFISLPLRHLRRVHDLLDALGDTTVSLYYLPDVMVSSTMQARPGEILGVTVIALRETPFHGYRGVAKRLMDLAIASTALILLAPVLLMVAAAIKLTSKGPVLFRQRRYGLDGHEIIIYKFRTMTVAEDNGWFDQTRRDDHRVTPLGRFLRRWSLDEFPQLVNVLQGRMSLVGPRPHAVAHNEEYRRLIKGYMIRHKVPPGITGLAQIKGCRGETPRLADMQARVRFDLEYVRNWSLLLDLRILLMTVPKIFNTDKAY
jgi:putative colanic acid biosynthesis UDP-glucose lipid carrier transferase